ncbi:hypothetical protein LSTR_LSTR008616 [Laodelphax striatellus]|uniref:Uncharacterized protein n=1 Tax=Laodelphax striatellus TaxID=195883 RepID=A0A482X0G9_LAOST|nr:hypothetical protein LSTR_LSTR008616 [Laodelphax striatellus]
MADRPDCISHSHHTDGDSDKESWQFPGGPIPHTLIFSKQQYFDSKGLFISIVFSVPILLNCMIMIASWLWQSSQLMAQLKRAQLQKANKNKEQNKTD